MLLVVLRASCCKKALIVILSLCKHLSSACVSFFLLASEHPCRSMADPDSWEDMESSAPLPTAAPPFSRHLNANAAPFAFNPSAASFSPSFLPPPPAIPTFLPHPLAPHPPTPTTLSAASTTPLVPILTDPPVAVAVPPAPLASDSCGLDHPLCVSQTASVQTDLSQPSEDVGEVDTAIEAAANGDIDKAAESVASLKLDEKQFIQDPQTTMEIDKVAVGPEALYEDDEESDKRLHLNVVFIGHVDAGKSTIGGQILYLTKMVDERTIQKYEREAKEKNRDSWYMAYIMDTNEEERAKGKTVEVGRAHFETEKCRFTILDAPGHKNYVPNMISGASQADVGVLVISARKGEFETGFERGGQTREHAQLAKTLGVSKLLVVVNKMDDQSVQWSKERFDEIEKKTVPFLRSCGYNVKKDVQFLPISGLLGSNMMERVSQNVCPWWNGPCLFEALNAVEPPMRDSNGPFRMPLIDKFKDMGTVVMGKIESGSVRRGDNLIVMPNKALVKVITVYRDNDEVNLAKPGENLRIRLSGIEEDDISSGFVLSSIHRPIPAVREFDAQLQILELLDHKAIFTAGYKAVLHIHAVVEECEIIELLQQIDPKTKKVMKKKVLFVKSGAVVVAHIQVNDTICVERFEDFPQLGRFTLRDEGKTVAIGKVVNIPAVSFQE